MKRHIEKTAKHVQKFDKRHTNFSNHTYWGIFITACIVWLNTFSGAMANMEESIPPYDQFQTKTSLNFEPEKFTDSSTKIEVSNKDLGLSLSPLQSFLGIGKLVDDPDSILGIASQVVSSDNTAGVVTFGPYEENLLAGEMYNVTFWLKVSDNTNTQNKILIDAFNWKTQHREYLEISPSQFQENNVYQEFNLQFLKGENGYEFRTFYYPDADFDLSVDYIIVEAQ